MTESTDVRTDVRTAVRPGARPGARPSPAAAGAPGRPLVVTADPALREELSRLAAAAGAVPEVVAEAGAALLAWARAPLVLVGHDLAAVVAARAPARRDDVLVVGWAPVADGWFRDAVAVGAQQVLGLPDAEAWLVDLLADAADPSPGRGTVVGVLGGSGGAGATTTACALAEVGARTGTAALVDLDPLGPGVDRVVGLEDTEGVRWDALGAASGRLSGRAFATALPRVRGVGVLTWLPGVATVVTPAAAREALAAAGRSHRWVVVDLPRAPGALLDEVVARCDRLLVVCAPTVAGVAGTARTCARLPADAPVGLVVRGRGDPAAVGRVVRRPVLGVLPHARGLDEAVDLGLGPVHRGRGPLARAVAELLHAVRTGEEVAA
ncbi:septum site-determining protein Ssd [Nocardioides perillae]|uniref:Secretion/DNA translocation related CpaE-like protein n=1 Tax=Nocardioides perillae TaxID=1119534 RepID=A0A7Y9RSZ4_9ACTN|nr:septum site-determining protein Ssd [Nocardioides perillae]NYG53987.1 secretion/DNA translocation related CpaE-like protein [Nocardioides perillae]